MRRIVSFLFLAILLLALGCTRLPEDFESLPVQRQVDTYVRYLENGGAPRLWARASIARHGAAAAGVIAAVLPRPIDDSYKTELLMILSEIQSAGTNLKGTPAESAIRALIQQPGASRDLREVAPQVLQIIENGTSSN
jgi:hypothetical protein